MRLIDADVLEKAIVELPYGYRGMIKNIIAEQPTVQPEQECLKCIFKPFKEFQPRWIPCSEPPEKDGVYIVYAPDYMGGSSSAKECYDGVMFSKYKNGKWSIEHGYYNRPNCVQAWRELPEPWRGEEDG